MYYFYLLVHNTTFNALKVLSMLDKKVAKIYRYCHLYIRFYERFDERFSPRLNEVMEYIRKKNEHMIGRLHNKQPILKLKTPKGKTCYAIVKATGEGKRIATFLTREMVQNSIKKHGFYYKNNKELTHKKDLI